MAAAITLVSVVTVLISRADLETVLVECREELNK